eukprot:scaffold1277_cov253-Pinguiococcus_pyrenoidosus.AAC.38
MRRSSRRSTARSTSPRPSSTPRQKRCRIFGAASRQADRPSGSSSSWATSSAKSCWASSRWRTA